MNNEIASGNQPDDVLRRMKSERRYLISRLVPQTKSDGSSSVRKIPYYVNGKPRMKTDTVEDIAQFASFDEATEEAKRRGDGWAIGFALGPDGTGNYWQGIDIDHVEENGLVELAFSLPGFVEYSISGTGVHAYGYGERFDALGKNESCIEAYCEGRYFVFTGIPCVRAS